MIKKICLLVVLVSSFYMIGCSQPPATVSSDGGREYFPNKEGNSWTYNLTWLGATDTYKMEISGTATVNGKNVQIFGIKITSPSGYDYITTDTYYLIDDSKVVYYGSAKYPSEQTILSFPLKVGNVWTIYKSGTIEATASVMAKEDVKVPAGTFSCFKIRSINSSGGVSNRMDYWVAKDVGLVKKEDYYNGSVDMLYELRSKTIN